MTATSTIDDQPQLQTRETGRRTNPLRPVPAKCGAIVSRPLAAHLAERTTRRPAMIDAAIARQSAQLPAFAPLLEELEIAGWSSHRRLLSGNFHDWVLLEHRAVLVTVGQVVGPEPIDAMEAALVAQAAWAAIRAHAYHQRDAGTLLSLASRSLWPAANSALQVCAAVALIDLAEGHVSVAMAGDCLAWRVRAASTEQLTIRQPMLGGAADFTYLGQSIRLSLRERLLLVADNPQRRSPKIVPSIGATFSRLDVESHRRMMATDAVATLRQIFEPNAADMGASTSIVAVKRR